MDCLFCKISSGEIKAQIIHHDADIIGIKDVKPQAPTHLLVIPKKHIASINEMTPEDKGLIGHMIYTAQHLAHGEGIGESGYRLLFNVNAQGGQEIYHIHLHLLGGRQMHWPPG